MALTVFVSAGTPADDSQREFRDAIVRAVETVGLTARMMSERDWDYKNPLRGLRRALSGCAGAIVIAYDRYRFPAGIEVRKDGQRQLTDVAFPTAWNQIEAAMAYEKGLPLLVVAEEGLRRDAMFEETGDIRPFWTKLDANVSRSDGFIGYLQSWREDVLANAHEIVNREKQLGQEVSVRQLLFSLPWYEGLALLATVIATIVGTLSIGYRLGAGQWPF